VAEHSISTVNWQSVEWCEGKGVSLAFFEQLVSGVVGETKGKKKSKVELFCTHNGCSSVVRGKGMLKQAKMVLPFWLVNFIVRGLTLIYYVTYLVFT